MTYLVSLLALALTSILATAIYWADKEGAYHRTGWGRSLLGCGRVSGIRYRSTVGVEGACLFFGPVSGCNIASEFVCGFRPLHPKLPKP